MQYPVTMASFQKFRYAKSFMTFAEDHGVSWCFKNLTNKQAAIDGYQQPRLKDRVIIKLKIRQRCVMDSETCTITIAIEIEVALELNYSNKI